MAEDTLNDLIVEQLAAGPQRRRVLNALRPSRHLHETSTPMPKIAFLFPGQGAQAVGMGRELDQELPAARALFDRAGEILGFDLQAVCFDGPAEALEATDVSQPAIFVASLAALEGLKATEPEVVDGLRRGRRAEPGRVHGPGLRRRARLRDRPAGSSAAGARRCRRRPSPLPAA